MRIGPYRLEGRLILAPMAGVTDLPFRRLCRRYGASMAVSEMVSSNPELQGNRKTLLRSEHRGQQEPRAIQIVGADPNRMAEAARLNVARGAQIVDINMGCPAKKVCNAAAGSALLRDEPLVGRILDAVVRAVDVPVTLKMRTGWDPANRNAEIIARIAESCGVQAVTLHGRTRACGFSGQAEYTTIAEVKAAVNIPVIANGDIDSPEKAIRVLEQTGADALMIGRAALGKPWLFGQIRDALELREVRPQPAWREMRDILSEHLAGLHELYGEYLGVRIARKHIGWYARNLNQEISGYLGMLFKAETAEKQILLAQQLFAPNLREHAI